MTSTDANAPTPAGGADKGARPWGRGLFMLIFVILFAVAETILTLIAIVQFGWLMVYREPQPALRRFGAALAEWLRQVGRYQSLDTEDRPFPWADWPSGR